MEFSFDMHLDPATTARGEMFIRWAFKATNLRADSAIPLGLAVATTDENWPVAIAAAGSMATDAVDGMLARKGATMLGIDTSSEGAVKDPQADKDLMNGLMAGLCFRYLRQLRPLSAAVVGANYLASQYRDRRMSEDRALVVSHQLDPKQLKAIHINKAKMGIQSAAVEALISPLTRKTPYRVKALAVLSLGTATGWIGERIFRQRTLALIAKGFTPAKEDK